MFAPSKTFGALVADAVDLAIDFATLGEYGLEPVDERRCERRDRTPRRELAFAAPSRAERLASRA